LIFNDRRAAKVRKKSAKGRRKKAKSDPGALPMPFGKYKGVSVFDIARDDDGLDERLELLDPIEDRLDAHPGALRASMKRGNSILAGRCPKVPLLPSWPICSLTLHP
jgi:hypothetical protein